MRHYLWSLVALTLAAASLDARGLRDKISDLFIFGAGQDPLFLSGTASDQATALHADHFVPSAVSDNGTLISFIGTAISQNVANIPVSATSGGSTFHFEGGAPAPTPVSPRPGFAPPAPGAGKEHRSNPLPNRYPMPAFVLKKKKHHTQRTPLTLT